MGACGGTMPKDADFNCGVNDGRTPVDQYSDVTRSSHGAVDFWGNVWEWTSTLRSDSGGVTVYGVKGGSCKSDRTNCRTEYHDEGRDGWTGYNDAGFRVIQVKDGVEPEQKVELATLGSPVVSATSTSADSITLSWQHIDGAPEYQIFEYFTDTGLVQILQTTNDTSVTIIGLEPGSTHSYIVQPISYREIADNVSAENSVTATCGESAAENPAIVIEMQIGSPTMLVNDETKSLDTKPAVINDRTLLPIRFIAEKFGFDVIWDGENMTVTIQSKSSNDT